jgi:membrane-associated phospholipid phosphatase
MRAAFLLAVVLATPAPAQRYLSGPGVALMEVLPPAPVTGSPQDEVDRATFHATRTQEGTPRWAQAISDVDERVPAMLADFSPAAGRIISVEATPALARLLTRMRGDVAAAVNAVKPIYARKRPFLIDAGAVCQPRAALEGSFDYPSGHTSWGTAVSLILAELMPDRASALLTRGRDYGDSRIICGAHNASAVAAGRVAAAAVVARLHGDADFRADLDGVRSELDAVADRANSIVIPAGAHLRGTKQDCMKPGNE